MKHNIYKTLFFAVCIFILSSFLTTNSGKLFIDNETSSTEFEQVMAIDSAGVQHSHLHINVGLSGGRDVVVEESGRLVLGSSGFVSGSPIICSHDNSSDTYLTVEGDAEKMGDAFWDSTSDRRLKKNISPLRKSRDKFLDLKIYRFTYKKSGKVRYGIIAQEVKDDFPHSMGIFWENGVEYYSFNPNNLFFMGMKVIQENSTEIIKQDEQIRNLAAENQGIRDKLETQQKEIEAIKAALANLDIDTPRPTITEVKPKPIISTIEINIERDIPQLQQNIPNPFQRSTTIPYYLPEATQSATLLIHDMTGKTIAKHTLANQKGEGKIQVHIDDAQLRGSIYTYSLYVNDQLVNTKTMTLLTK